MFILEPSHTDGSFFIKMSKKNGLDQYYTCPAIAEKIVNLCVEKLPKTNYRLIIEPSAGYGVFLNYFPHENYKAYDIEPKNEKIEKKDFFDVSSFDFLFYNSSEITAIGNPPFGFSSSLAIKFFNHCTNLADTICFIVPKTFKKASVQNRLNLYYYCEYQEDLPKNSFILHNQAYDVPCVFQIWKRGKNKREVKKIKNNYIKFIKKENAGPNTFCIRRVGGRAGKVLDGIDYSETTTYFVEELIPGVKNIIKNYNFSCINDTAGVRSLSKQELISIIEKKIEK